MLNEIAEGVAPMIYIFNKVEQFVKWKSVLFVCVFFSPLYTVCQYCVVFVVVAEIKAELHS